VDYINAARNDFSPQFVASVIRLEITAYVDYPMVRLEAYFKETCHWRCGTSCTAFYDDTKCTICSTEAGIEGLENGDGTYTCRCHSDYIEDEVQMLCFRNFYSYFCLFP
jgi:hypothetical protein